MTMTLVATSTVGAAGAASIEFTSIPQTGTDLLLVVSGRSEDSVVAQSSFLRFNGDRGQNYSRRLLTGDGSSVTSGAATSGSILFFGFTGASATANTFGSLQVYIPNYSGSTQKTASGEAVVENNATSSSQGIAAGLWTSTAAITSIGLEAFLNFVQGSTASLYIITKA